eukprot:6485689-Pyramimonas_sp.AAC.1
MAPAIFSSFSATEVAAFLASSARALAYEFMASFAACVHGSTLSANSRQVVNPCSTRLVSWSSEPKEGSVVDDETSPSQASLMSW